jgi:large subunit ribosomal protein L30
MAAKQLKVTLIHSPSGSGYRQMACVRGLGLRRIRHTVVLKDTPAVRGMINKVSHLLRYEEVS